MAWEWSHSTEAYSNAYNNLQEKDPEWIASCFAEWMCDDINGARIALDEAEEILCGAPRESAYLDGTYEAIRDACLEEMEKFGCEYIADKIWERAEKQRLCDNGGFDAWMCSSGCHYVSFDRKEEDDD